MQKLRGHLIEYGPIALSLYSWLGHRLYSSLWDTGCITLLSLGVSSGWLGLSVFLAYLLLHELGTYRLLLLLHQLDTGHVAALRVRHVWFVEWAAGSGTVSS